jgi:hypothetical protein
LNPKHLTWTDNKAYTIDDDIILKGVYAADVVVASTKILDY